MSRWADDPEAAADALILRSLDDISLPGRVLLVNQGGALPSRLTAQGLAFEVWNRRLAHGLAAAAWPAPGPFDVALVRLPKARDEQAMTLHATLGALAAGGRLILYGGNDEGIRSAAATLKELAEGTETMAVRGHGRVVAARRPASTAGLRDSLPAWRAVSRLEIAGAPRDWVSYPGTFAAGRLDEGTALLLSVLPPLAADARVLDYGCGSGAIAAAALALQPGLKVDALDNDAVALEAARENAPEARLVLGARPADAGRRDYDAILSNPPLHSGIAEDHGLLDRLVAEAPSHLASGGVVQIVVQRRVPLERSLAQHFAKVEIAAETGRYRVWSCRRCRTLRV
jgi:16S rRNA (guanine1207-N2)-methyltransferase